MRLDFALRLEQQNTYIGHIQLNNGRTDEEVLYWGNVGYSVDQKYRGHRYAYRAFKLILPIARYMGMKEIWLTINPDNFASQKTALLAGAKFVDTLLIPKTHSIYKVEKDKVNCRYRLSLEESPHELQAPQQPGK